ncbi:MAG TPA: 5'-3' exonuclease H3TH domain-containing protein [Chloroflexota bacterium]|nr:5'-3' exonuclease H3TH domain-containing protein [Chloroflexota bacterium]
MRRAASLLLIDGHHLYYRVFHAVDQGRHAAHPAAVADAFAITVKKALREFQPSHLCLAFDHPTPSFRHALFPAYRAGRHRRTDAEQEHHDHSLAATVARTTAEGWPHGSLPGYEADDHIASLTAEGVRHRCLVSVLSGDSDLLQLTALGAILYRPGPNGPSRADAAWVRANLGIEPDQLVDFKALTGDPSDRIPGLPGVGPKKAATLLAAHGSLETIYADLSRIPAPLAAALRAHERQIRLNVQLVRLVATLAVTPTLDECALH